jgi:hypothetical protein
VKNRYKRVGLKEQKEKYFALKKMPQVSAIFHYCVNTTSGLFTYKSDFELIQLVH